MPAVNLTVEVHGIQPSWVYRITDTDYTPPIYRFYINNDLLTERTWIWNNNNYIQENAWINSVPNSQNTLTIEPIIKNPAQIKFKLSNFNIINYPFEYKQINEHTISFTLQ
jgi:hypothetical protein